MNRKRKDGYAVTDKNAAIADLLFVIVTHLDCGKPAYEMAAQVECLSILMRQ